MDRDVLVGRMVEVACLRKEGHLGSSLSVLDILMSLYENTIIPKNSDDRNRLILSKGHSSLGLYVVLESKGLLEEPLKNFSKYSSILGGHPSDKIKHVECSTGSLGHGLPIAVGMAMAYKTLKYHSHIYVIIGDGEMNEGTIWESLLLAAQYKLFNLTCIVDYNHSGDRALNLGSIAAKAEQFGWYSVEIDGHEPEILKSLGNIGHPDKPTLIVAHTIKGKGVSFMENNPEWHHKFPTVQDVDNVYKELHITGKNAERQLSLLASQNKNFAKSLIINTRVYGFFSSMFQILDNIKYCEENEVKPILNIGPAFLYQNGTEGADTWNNFFESINDYKPEGQVLTMADLDPGATVIEGGRAYFLVLNFILDQGFNHMLWQRLGRNDPDLYNHRIEVNRMVDLYLTPISYIQRQVENFYEENLIGHDKILSVHVRGGDYQHHNIEQYISAISATLAAEKYTKIFIASDTTEAIQILTDRFPIACHYDTSRRVEKYTMSSPVCHIVAGDDKVTHGQDVLIECLLLGKGHKIICINSNVAAMACYINPEMEIEILAKANGGG